MGLQWSRGLQSQQGERTEGELDGGGARSPPNSNFNLCGQVPWPFCTQPLVSTGFPASLHPLPHLCLAEVLRHGRHPGRKILVDSETALAWVSSAQDRPWLLTIHRPREDNRRDHTPEHLRFSPDSYTKLRGEFLFIWQKGGTVCWRSRRRVRALTAELGSGMAEQQPGASEHGSCIAQQEHPPASPHLLENSQET